MEPLTLTIPEPQCRPGDNPDFSAVAIPPAGAAPRPALDAPADALSDLALTLIRVLDDDGRAVGPWAGALTFDDLRAGLEHMVTLCIFDERMLLAQRQQKTSFY
ncbi:MAG: hypothetical protein Q4G46_16030, partial [Propionibacteriaceae bacterium]|nr:hypothetical protein [Propionibacteriaceae bacterium]